MNDLIRGAIAGAAATVPMTATIELLNRSLPATRQNVLPPRQITEEVADRADVKRKASEQGLDVATMINHFGFGAAAGLPYAPIAQRLELPSVVTGIGYGLIVWAGAYAGVLPALELQRKPQHRPASLNGTMIVGHIVWGAALGLIEKNLRPGRRTEWKEYQAEIFVAANTGVDARER